MRTAIKFYYNIDVEKINFENQIYYFENYILKEVNSNINYELYNFFTINNIYIYKIILNKDNNYITHINNKNYILLFKDKNYDNNNIDIQLINRYSINLQVDNEIKWDVLWSNKIDYYENNILKTNNKNILEVFPYYLALSETALRLFNESNYKYTVSTCHKRIDNISNLYSIDNFIIDYKARDYSEYIKYKFFIENTEIEDILKDFDNIILNPEDMYLLFIRLLFPTYFYDCIENNNNLEKYISKINLYELLLYKIYYKISLLIVMPKIDWLIKKSI